MTISLHWEGPIAHIRLNRPEVLNALNAEMARGLRDICQGLAGEARLRAVLLTGEGRAFMAGGDVSMFVGEGATALIAEVIAIAHEALEALIALPVPVIAAVQGAVAGGGIGVACAADVVIAADDAKFLLAYSQIGTSPDCGATWILPRTLGLRRALGFALLEDSIDAATALQIGLVNRVVPVAELPSHAMAAAQRAASGATLAFGRTKALMRQSVEHDLAAQLAAERENFIASSRTADFAEGVGAFRARRKPGFTGA